MSDDVGLTEETSRIASIEPIEPDWRAVIEKYMWWICWVVAIAVVLTAGQKSGIYNITDPDNTLSWLGVAIVWVIGLIGLKIAKWAVAYRRYGYSPSEYHAAQRRARGELLTPKEAAEKRAKWEVNRVRSIEDELNELQSEVENLSQVEATITRQRGKFEIDIESRNTAGNAR